MARKKPDDELLKRLAKVDATPDEGYLTWTWAGNLTCFWCGVIEPKSWDDHEEDCPQKEVWERFGAVDESTS
jgi:hypothetical protein